MDQAFICCDSNNPASGSDGWIENGLNNCHYPGSHHMLFEGNFTHQMGEDETHGNSIYNTYFRNYSTGYRLPSWVNAFDGATINDLTGSPQGTPGPLTPAETQLYTYWETFMGNVLGYPNYSTSVNGWTLRRYKQPGRSCYFRAWGRLHVRRQRSRPQGRFRHQREGWHDDRARQLRLPGQRRNLGPEHQQ